MKFYEVETKYNGKLVTKVFNEFTHSEARVNENNLYTRANNYVKEIVSLGNYDRISLIEIDTVTYEKQVFAQFEK